MKHADSLYPPPPLSQGLAAHRLGEGETMGWAGKTRQNYVKMIAVASPKMFGPVLKGFIWLLSTRHKRNNKDEENDIVLMQYNFVVDIFTFSWKTPILFILGSDEQVHFSIMLVHGNSFNHLEANMKRTSFGLGLGNRHSHFYISTNHFWPFKTRKGH